MPRTSALPPREREIGERLREIRKEAGFSLVSLGTKIGADAGRLRSYENGSNPVPFWVAQAIAEECDCCQRWLALGELPKRPVVEIDVAVKAAIPERMRFSEAYDQVVGEDILATLEAVAEAEGVAISEVHTEPFTFLPPIGTPKEKLLLREDSMIVRKLQYLMQELPFGARRALAKALDKLAKKFAGKRVSEAEKRSNIDIQRAEITRLFQQRIRTPVSVKEEQ